MQDNPLDGIALNGKDCDLTIGERQLNKRMAFVTDVADLCRKHLSDEPGILTVLAVQDVVRRACAARNISLAEARHLYRHFALRNTGEDPEEMPGRPWTPLPDPEGPWEWQPPT